MVEMESVTKKGFYFSKKLSLMVQMVEAGHALPSSDDWEFIGSDITPSEAMAKLRTKYPNIEPDQITFTTK